MRKFVFLLAACALTVVGCQPQPIIIQEQRPVVVRPPIVVNGCNYYNHCGLYGCPVCRANNWYVCNPHNHCGCCPTCRSNGWVGVGIHIGRGGVGVGVGVR